MRPGGAPDLRPNLSGASWGFDAIVVLGAAVRPGGAPSPALVRRVGRAVRLFRAGAAPMLVMTGGLGRHPPAEAELMAALAIRAGVPPERILLEDRAATTFESARNCAALLQERGWRRVLLVTDGFHLRRSLLIFRAFGRTFGAVVAGSAAGGRIGWRRRLLYGAREGIGLAWYAARAVPVRLRARPGRRPATAR